MSESNPISPHLASVLDDVVHHRARLGILTVLGEVRTATFSYLKSPLGLTDGNLGRHIEVLAGAAMTGASTRELMGRMGHASMDAALIYQHRTADRDRAIADAIDVMLTRYDECPETLVGTDASESGGDGHGHGEGTSAVFCCQRALSPTGRWRPIRLFATLFACGAGDGNRTRAISLGNLPPPVVRAPGTFCHVVAIDLC